MRKLLSTIVYARTNLGKISISLFYIYFQQNNVVAVELIYKVLYRVEIRKSNKYGNISMHQLLALQLPTLMIKNFLLFRQKTRLGPKISMKNTKYNA